VFKEGRTAGASGRASGIVRISELTSKFRIRPLKGIGNEKPPAMIVPAGTVNCPVTGSVKTKGLMKEGAVGAKVAEPKPNKTGKSEFNPFGSIGIGVMGVIGTFPSYSIRGRGTPLENWIRP